MKAQRIILLIVITLFGYSYSQACSQPGMKGRWLRDMYTVRKGNSNGDRITSAEGEGAMWFSNSQIRISPRFEIYTRIFIDAIECVWYKPWLTAWNWAIDGIAFMFTKSFGYYNGAGGALTYAGMPNGFAVELDLFQNSVDIGSDTMAITKCIGGSCFWTNQNQQAKNPYGYDKCSSMVYDVRIKYESSTLKIYLGNTLMLQDNNIDLQNAMDSSAYFGIGASQRGNDRGIHIDFNQSFLCEDDIGGATGGLYGNFVNNAISAGQNGQLWVNLQDSTNSQLFHMGVSIPSNWWQVTVTNSCGSIINFSMPNDRDLHWDIVPCTTQGNYNIVVVPSKGSSVTLPYTVNARGFELLTFQFVNSVSLTNNFQTINGNVYAKTGSQKGDYGLSLVKGVMTFQMISTDIYGNPFDLSTNYNALGINVICNGCINPAFNITKGSLNGVYFITVTLNAPGDYYIQSTKAVNLANNKLWFTVIPDYVPSPSNSICTLLNALKAPVIDVNTQLSFVCTMRDQNNNNVDTASFEKYYNATLGCSVSLSNNAGVITKIGNGVVNNKGMGVYTCIYTVALPGTYIFTGYYLNPTEIDLPALINTAKVKGAPTDLLLSKLWDFSKAAFVATQDKINMALNPSNDFLTLIDFQDLNGNSIGTNGYSSTFNLNSVTGSFSNSEGTTYGTQLSFTYTTFNNNTYVGVALIDSSKGTFIRRSSFNYILTLSFNSKSISITMPLPMPTLNGLLASAYPLSLQNIVVSNSTLSGYVGSQLTIGKFNLVTSTNNFYNYNIDQSRFKIKISNNNAGTTASVVNDPSNIEGQYMILFKSTVVGSYNLVITIDDTVIGNTSGISITVNQIAKLVKLNKKTTVVDSSSNILSPTINSNTSVTYIDVFDEFNNLLSLTPTSDNKFLSITISLTIDLVQTVIDPSQIYFDYNTQSSSYRIVDSFRQPGNYVFTLTCTASSQSLTFSYYKSPSIIDGTQSSAQYAVVKVKVGGSGFIKVTLLDTYGFPINTNDDLFNSEIQKVTIQGKNANGDIATFALNDYDLATATFTSDPINIPGNYAIVALYGQSKIGCTYSCNLNIFLDSFVFANSRVNIVLSNSILLRTTQIQLVKNNVEVPVFLLSFYNNLKQQLLAVDRKTIVTGAITGNNFKLVLNMDWQGNNLMVFAVSDPNVLKAAIAGQYSLDLTYNGATISYPLQFSGDQDNNNAGNGDYVLDNTYFSTTNLNNVAGQSVSFSIELRTSQNLRYSQWTDLTLFKLLNNANLTAKQISMTLQRGQNTGQYLIFINNTVSSTVDTPILINLAINGVTIKRQVKVVTTYADLSYLTISSSNILNNNVLVGNPTTITNNLNFQPFDKYGNIQLDLFNDNIFSISRIVGLLNIQHTDNSLLTISASKDLQGQQFIISVQSTLVGTVTITSNFLTDTYTYSVVPGPVSGDNCNANLDSTTLTSGSKFTITVNPYDMYNNLITNLSPADQAQFNIIYNNITTSNFTLNNNSLVFSDQLNKVGSYPIVPNYKGVKIKCTNCNVVINIGPYSLVNSKLFLVNIDLSENIYSNIFNLVTTAVPHFSLYIYDQYDNIFTSLPDVTSIVPTWSGDNSTIKLCSTTKSNKIDITPCYDKVNLQDWQYLLTSNLYNIQLAITVKNNTITKSYNVAVTGYPDDGDSSNADVDPSKTYFSQASLSSTAGKTVSVLMELRTSDNKRRNFWYDTPTQNITFTYSKNYTINSNIVLGQKPGQYVVSFTSNVKFNNLTITAIIDRLAAPSISYYNKPDVPNSGYLVDANLNQMSTLTNGNADDEYAIRVLLFDKYNNIAEVAVSDFVYQFITPKVNASIASTVGINADYSITVLFDPIYAGQYLINSKFFNTSYTLNVDPGVPDRQMSVINAPDSSVAGDLVKVKVVCKDYNGNYCWYNNTKRLLSDIKSPFHVYYKFKQGNGYSNFAEINNIEMVKETTGKDSYDVFYYDVVLTTSGVNYFKTTLGLGAEIKANNSMATVAPGPYSFKNYSFQRLDSNIKAFTEIVNVFVEDNTHNSPTYRIYPRDQFLNSIDLMDNTTQYTAYVLGGKNNTIRYNLAINSLPSPVSYIDFVTNDKINTNNWADLVTGSYVLNIQRNSEIISFKITLVGTNADGDASNQPIDIQQTVINEANLQFVAGSSGSLIVELRSTDGLRRNDWNYNVTTTSIRQDASYTTKTINGGRKGVFLITVSSTLSNNFPVNTDGTINILVNGVVVKSLNPSVNVSPNVMFSATILNSKNIQLVDGNSDYPYTFKIQSIDEFNNLTPIDLDALSLSVIKPNKLACNIKQEKEVLTGLGFITVDNFLSGNYTIKSTYFSVNYIFFNSEGEISNLNSVVKIVKPLILAGDIATLLVYPIDYYNNNNTPSKVAGKVKVSILDTNRRTTTNVPVTVNSDSLGFSIQLQGSGSYVWTVTILGTAKSCNACTMKVNPNVAVFENSVYFCQYTLPDGSSNFCEDNIDNRYPFTYSVNLVDKYQNTLDLIDTSLYNFNNAIVYGRNLQPIQYSGNVVNNQYVFQISNSASSRAFAHIVSGSGYTFSFDFTDLTTKKKNTNNFKFGIKSIVNDAGYGNGDYVVNNSSLSSSFITAVASVTQSVVLRLLTNESLYFNDDIDSSLISLTTVPQDAAFTYTATKNSTQYGVYAINFQTTRAGNYNIMFSIQNSNGKTLNVTQKINYTVLPRLPPSSNNTILVNSLNNTVGPDTLISIMFRLYDKFNNSITNNLDVLNYIAPTINKIKLKNYNIVLNSDQVTYQVNFSPVYPPRNISINLAYDDGTNRLYLLNSDLNTFVKSDPDWTKTVVSSNRIVQMRAGKILDYSVQLADKNKVCVNLDASVPMRLYLEGPLEIENSNDRYKFNYSFSFTPAVNSTDCNQYDVIIPADQQYSDIGTYLIKFYISKDDILLNTYNQILVPDVMDSSKFLIQWVVNQDLDLVIEAGTPLLFTIQARDQFNNPTPTPIKESFDVVVTLEQSQYSVNNSTVENPIRLSKSEDTPGLITYNLTVNGAGIYSFKYIYQNVTYQFEENYGPTNLFVAAGPCDKKFTSINSNNTLKKLTNDIASYEFTCFDLKGNRIYSGGANFSVVFNIDVNTTDNKTFLKGSVVDNNDGTYSAEVVASYQANYTSNLYLNGWSYGNQIDFTVKDSYCTSDKPKQCSNSDKCVADLFDCLNNNSTNCTKTNPFQCKVGGINSCVSSVNKCDCPDGYIKCAYMGVCVLENKINTCTSSKPTNCLKTPLIPALCRDGICRKELGLAPSIRVCPVGYYACANFACVDSLENCPEFNVCPKNQVTCPDQSCAANQELCSTSITCTNKQYVVCPSGDCVANEYLCPKVRKCNSDSNSYLCPDNTCASNYQACPRTPICGKGKSLCSDLLCHDSC